MGSKIKASKKLELPSVDKPATTPKAKTGQMTISVAKPTHRIAELDRVRMDVRPLSRLQRKGLVEVTSALIESDVRLENGTPVKRQCHAIKWVLERFGEFAEK
jgi:hypothetical protein